MDGSIARIFRMKKNRSSLKAVKTKGDFQNLRAESGFSILKGSKHCFYRREKQCFDSGGCGSLLTSNCEAVQNAQIFLLIRQDHV